jgi:hypothetical protein
MKLRHFLYRIPHGKDHDRLLDQLLTRASDLGLNMERAAVSDGQNAASVIAFVGIEPEPGCAFSPGLERVNRNLELLRDGL